MSVRRALSLACFVAIVAAALRPQNLTAVLDYGRLQKALTISPDRGWYPDYPQFLEAVRSQTAPGDAIAIVVPPRKWEAYRYAYYRASYVLAGREVLPIVDAADGPHSENLGQARWIAVWPAQLAPPHVKPVLAAHRGVLLRR